MVRFAVENDLSAVCHIRRQVHQIHVDGRPDIFRMPAADEMDSFDSYIYDIFSDESYGLLVCEVQHAITGYALIHRVIPKNHPAKQKETHFFIEQFGVDELQRKKGYGTELMQGIVELARKELASSISLDVWAFNESAEKFYRKLGMKTKQTFLELTL